MSACKWLSDDFSEICVNADCPICADFCPLTYYPWVCRYYEAAEKEDAQKDGEA